MISQLKRQKCYTVRNVASTSLARGPSIVLLCTGQQSMELLHHFSDRGENKFSVSTRLSCYVIKTGGAEAATVLPDLWHLCTIEGKLRRYVLDPGQWGSLAQMNYSCQMLALYALRQSLIKWLCHLLKYPSQTLKSRSNTFLNGLGGNGILPRAVQGGSCSTPCYWTLYGTAANSCKARPA